MPDWLTHTLTGWIIGKTTKQDISLLLIGALIPDTTKLHLLFPQGYNTQALDLFLPLHTPFGALLIALLISLFFKNITNTMLLLTIGLTSHFILDFFLINVSGGMPLLFPFSWDEYQYGLIRSDDYTMTLLAILVAISIYLIYFLYERRKQPLR